MESNRLSKAVAAEQPAWTATGIEIVWLPAGTLTHEFTASGAVRLTFTPASQPVTEPSPRELAMAALERLHRELWNQQCPDYVTSPREAWGHFTCVARQLVRDEMAKLREVRP